MQRLTDLVYASSSSSHRYVLGVSLLFSGVISRRYQEPIQGEVNRVREGEACCAENDGACLCVIFLSSLRIRCMSYMCHYI